MTDETLDYLAAEPDLTLWAYNTLMFGAYTRPDRPIGEIYHHPADDPAARRAGRGRR